MNGNKILPDDVSIANCHISSVCSVNERVDDEVVYRSLQVFDG